MKNQCNALGCKPIMALTGIFIMLLTNNLKQIQIGSCVFCAPLDRHIGQHIDPGGGTPIWNRRGCSSEILNLTPKGDHLGVA